MYVHMCAYTHTQRGVERHGGSVAKSSNSNRPHLIKKAASFFSFLPHFTKMKFPYSNGKFRQKQCY